MLNTKNDDIQLVRAGAGWSMAGRGTFIVAVESNDTIIDYPLIEV